MGKENIMITKQNLKTGSAPLIEKNGWVNGVLVLLKNSQYCQCNTNMGKWQVSNVVWYNNNLENYEGYIELEFDVPAPAKDSFCKFCDPNNLII